VQKSVRAFMPQIDIKAWLPVHIDTRLASLLDKQSAPIRDIGKSFPQKIPVLQLVAKQEDLDRLPGRLNR
jgi:hypothetical protein